MCHHDIIVPVVICNYYAKKLSSLKNYLLQCSQRIHQDFCRTS